MTVDQGDSNSLSLGTEAGLGPAGVDTNVLSVTLLNNTHIRVPLAALQDVLDNLGFSGEYTQEIEGWMPPALTVTCPGAPGVLLCRSHGRDFAAMIPAGHELGIDVVAATTAALQLRGFPTPGTVTLDVGVMAAESVADWLIGPIAILIPSDTYYQIAMLLVTRSGTLIQALERGDGAALPGAIMGMLSDTYDIIRFNLAAGIAGAVTADEINAAVAEKEGDWFKVAKFGAMQITTVAKVIPYAISVSARFASTVTGHDQPDTVTFDYAAPAAPPMPTPTYSEPSNPPSFVEPSKPPIPTPGVEPPDGSTSPGAFAEICGLAFSPTGTLYVADCGESQILAVAPNGDISVVAGSGVVGSVDGPGQAASFNGPEGLAFDRAGNLYVADTWNNKIRKVTPAGVVTTLAGSGAERSVDGTGLGASFDQPGSLAIDRAGNIYVASAGNTQIREVTPAGVVSSFVVTGAPGFEGTLAGSSLLAIDGADNLYVAFSDDAGFGVRRVNVASSDLTVTTVASGTEGGAIYPMCLAVDGTGNLYIGHDQSDVIFKVSPTGAGAISPGSLTMPTACAADDAGNLYGGVETGSMTSQIVRITPSGQSSVFAK